MGGVMDRYGSAVVTLPSDREILITRQFAAPAALLSKAYTTPELVRRWWGFETPTQRRPPPTMTLTVLHTSKGHRDMHIASGMEEGLEVSMDRLEVASDSLR